MSNMLRMGKVQELKVRSPVSHSLDEEKQLTLHEEEFQLHSNFRLYHDCNVRHQTRPRAFLLGAVMLTYSRATWESVFW